VRERIYSGFVVSVPFIVIASAILVYGVLGEWRAILAIYHRSATRNTNNLVLSSVLILLIGTVMLPVLRVTTGLYQLGRKLYVQAKSEVSEPANEKLENPSE
jgi:hypothetical protein